VAEKYPFLTDEWFVAARKIRDELATAAVTPTQEVRMNLIITDAPFNSGAEIKTHVDTSSGEMKMDTGHIDDPDVTITVDYDTTKAIFVDQDAAVGMQAFMAGKIKVQGDMTKLMTLSQGSPDPTAVEIGERIKAITADTASA
jgi:putative sterol carrier protein